MKHLHKFLFAPVIMCLCLTQPRAAVLFSEDFESGLGQWILLNGLMVTTDRPFAGSNCGTFAFPTTGSFADRSELLPVVAGERYLLEVAYRTDGGGGYIGIDKFDPAKNRLGEQWLIGDGDDPSNLSTWDCNVTNCPPSALGTWKVYRQEYTMPAGVGFIDIKIEDFAGGLPNGPPVCFDSIKWSTAGPFHVDIDIKPGDDTNSINLDSAGAIPVAILSSALFDARTIDPGTVSLAGARVKMVGKSDKLLSHEEDVNGDGLPDLVCQVNTAQFLIEPGDSTTLLEARTFDGTAVEGQDTVRIIPDK